MRIVNENIYPYFKDGVYTPDEIRAIVSKYSKYLKQDNYNKLMELYEDEQMSKIDFRKLLGFLYESVDINVLDYITRIPNRCFEVADFPEQYRNIVLSSKVKEIGDNAFADSNISTIDMSQTQITEIPKGCFGLCTDLTDIKFPKNLKTIGELAFFSCVALDQIILPETVETLDYECFRNCDGLTYLRIPASVTSIANKFISSDDTELVVSVEKGSPADRILSRFDADIFTLERR